LVSYVRFLADHDELCRSFAHVRYVPTALSPHGCFAVLFGFCVVRRPPLKDDCLGGERKVLTSFFPLLPPYPPSVPSLPTSDLFPHCLWSLGRKHSRHHFPVLVFLFLILPPGRPFDRSPPPLPTSLFDSRFFSSLAKLPILFLLAILANFRVGGRVLMKRIPFGTLLGHCARLITFFLFIILPVRARPAAPPV